MAPALCLVTKKILLQMNVLEPPSVGKNSLGGGGFALWCCVKAKINVLITVFF